VIPLLFLTGCGLRNVLPGPPALDTAARRAFDQPAPSPAQYSGPPRVTFPVLPQQVWGLRYALDVVLESTHPDWSMHEYARVDLPEGPLWLAKDADREGTQNIVANVPDIRSWAPEAPVPRIEGPVSVEDHSTADHVDLKIAYTNPHGQPTVVTYAGPAPTKPSNPRNGNTMGHSRNSVSALLDLHLFRPGGDATITIGGVEQKIRKMWGLYPMKFILAQTQAGFAIANFRQEATADGFHLVRPADGDWPTASDEQWTVADGWARHDGSVTSLRYHFRDGELDRAEVWQRGLESFPAMDVVFTPAVPDLRRPFPGVVTSRFAVDVAGQEGHGTGELRCSWTDADTVRVDMIPTAPRWFADRPLRAEIHYTDGAVTTHIARIPG
jgi:hypothetical protein